ncbi:MAG: hypothetical protein EOP88_23385 [Verrucomicrobiaceae bacterium]|nr:MAG: hypothetical protein EOP88_23385 [Verrucomicrobiaceae bacterium]
MGMMDSDKMTSAPCPHCGKLHEFELWMLEFKRIPLCDTCAKLQTQTWDAKKAPASWGVRYRRALPLDYQQAQTGKIPPCYASALDWTAEEHRGGVGLVGPSGSGKSCAMACLLWKLEMRFIWWSGTEARDVGTQSAMSSHPDHAEACKLWQKAMTVPILVLDDLSQGRMTEAWSSRLFDLTETRKSRGLPTFWTSQIPLEELRQKMARQNGGDTEQAMAISRRLGQHSLVLSA